jgi:hypothetical protein
MESIRSGIEEGRLLQTEIKRKLNLMNVECKSRQKRPKRDQNVERRKEGSRLQGEKEKEEDRHL